jgi:hypothetical protein
VLEPAAEDGRATVFDAVSLWSRIVAQRAKTVQPLTLPLVC